MMLFGSLQQRRYLQNMSMEASSWKSRAQKNLRRTAAGSRGLLALGRQGKTRP
jgi:hypothetical protein